MNKQMSGPSLPFVPAYDIGLINAIQDDVPGMMTAPVAHCLYRMALATPKNGLLVEIGSYCGLSTIIMAAACRVTQRRVVSIDPRRRVDDTQPSWVTDDYGESFRNNIERWGVGRYVEPVDALSQDVEWKRPIDLLFIDGDHTYERASHDAETFIPWVVPGGWVAMHDVKRSDSRYDGVVRAWSEIVEPQLCDTHIVDSLAYGRKRRE